MKTFFFILGLISLLGITGCEIEEHGHRGGYYGPAEYGHGEYRHDYHHDDHWDRDYRY